MLTQRQETILSLIVDVFTQTHEPVGSKALQSNIEASSATIRNDMARLEKMGFLEKAHTSSGRRPSLLGFQYFVEHALVSEHIDEQDAYEVVKAFDFEAFKLDDILEKAAEVLADLTGYTALVLDVEPREQRLTGFTVVQLSHHDALAIMTLDESKPVTVQFAIPKNFLSKDLECLKLLVRERLLGQKVLDIHYKLRTEVPQVIQKYFTTMDNVLDLFDYIFAALFQENLFVAGKVNSLTYADLTTYQLLDQPSRLALELRRQMTPDSTTTIDVAASSEEGLQQLTVMTQSFLVPYRGMGLLSVIGPVEMNYRRVVSLVHLVSKVLALKLVDYYRYLNSNHYEVEKGDTHGRR